MKDASSGTWKAMGSDLTTTGSPGTVNIDISAVNVAGAQNQDNIPYLGGPHRFDRLEIVRVHPSVSGEQVFKYCDKFGGNANCFCTRAAQDNCQMSLTNVALPGPGAYFVRICRNDNISVSTPCRACFNDDDCNLQANLDPAISADGPNAVITAPIYVNFVAPSEPAPTTPDLDGDGVYNDADNCPTIANGIAQELSPGIGNQTNSDPDTKGDACDSDDDNDGLCDSTSDLTGCTLTPSGKADSCRVVPNNDHPQTKKHCDGDYTKYGVVQLSPAPNFDIAAGEQCDQDADGIGDECDACPHVSDASNQGSNPLLEGPSCGPCGDANNNGSVTVSDALLANAQTCTTPSATCSVVKCDVNLDGVCTKADADLIFQRLNAGRKLFCSLFPDSDNDRIPNATDTCPNKADAVVVVATIGLTQILQQSDIDGDNLGDACDMCPYWASIQQDTDGDGIGDECLCGDSGGGTGAPYTGDGRLNVSDLISVNQCIRQRVACPTCNPPYPADPPCDNGPPPPLQTQKIECNYDGYVNVSDQICINLAIYTPAIKCDNRCEAQPVRPTQSSLCP